MARGVETMDRGCRLAARAYGYEPDTSRGSSTTCTEGYERKQKQPHEYRRAVSYSLASGLLSQYLVENRDKFLRHADERAMTSIHLKLLEPILCNLQPLYIRRNSIVLQT